METVLVTGANGNLGTAVCLLLAQIGWNVCSVDSSDGDLSLQQDTEQIFKQSPKPLKAVVHLVGGIAAGKPLEELSISDFQAMLTLNVYTAVNVLRSAVAEFKQNGGGSIVTIGAQSVIHPVADRAAYSSAKAAVVSLTQAVAEEGRTFSIRANSILPSILKTPANLEWATEEEARGWLTPEQVAQTIAHLIDPACGISGAVIPMFGSVPF